MEKNFFSDNEGLAHGKQREGQGKEEGGLCFLDPEAVTPCPLSKL